MRGFTPAPKPRRPLAWTIRDGGADIALTGDLDEGSDLEAVAREVSGGKVVIDVGGVGRINSFGVSRWIRFLEGITRVRGRRVSLIGLPTAFAAAAALVPNMLKGTTIDSVLLVYRCDDCNREEEVAVRSAKEASAGRACSACRAAMTGSIDREVVVGVLGG